MKQKNSISSFTIIVAFISVALMGIVLVPLLPIKLAPSRTLPGLSVNFSMPNNSARVVEIEVTSKLESMLARIEGLRKISSTSGNGWGRISLELDKHTSIDDARFEASAIIRQTWHELPHEVNYPTISIRRPDENASRPFMTFTLNSSNTPITIQQYAENNIKPHLNDISGLYKIEIRGATPMEWQLTYDINQLQSLGISVKDIQDAISRHYRTDFLGMAKIDDNNAITSLRAMLVSDVDNNIFDASARSLKSKYGNTINLDQIVEIKHAEQEVQSHYRINGLNSIYISLTAEETANQLQLKKNIQQAIEEVQSVLPLDYEIHNSYDATEYIKEELDKIYMRSGLTVLILLLFVFIITRNIRYLYLIVVTLSINLAIAAIFYYLFGLEIQIYSLAGITISLSLIIDNTIIMTDHLMNQGNKNAFIPILAATMTTIGALSIIFFLDEKIRLNLQDFAAVVIINLSVSLVVALFFVPAMVDRIKLKKKPIERNGLLHKLPFHPRRITVYFNRLYGYMIKVLSIRKWIPFTIIILIFGLPIFLIPDKINKNTILSNQYNKIFDNSTYKEKVKPIINKALGGTLRLFVDKVFEGSYFTPNEEVILTITASMPNGTTLPQMNTLIEKMERYLSEFSGIRQFQTEVSTPRRASIRVFFTKEHERGGFPYQLKNSVISKALELGGGSWGVYGLADQGFSNDVPQIYYLN